MNSVLTEGQVTESPRASRGAAAELIPVLLGAPVSLLAIAGAWHSSGMRWALDWDVLSTVALTLVPLGPACLAASRALIVRPSRPDQIPLAVLAWLSMAWAEVWLDGGIYTGWLGKLLGGTSALLGTPLAAAVGFGVLAVWAPARRGAAVHWPLVVLAAVQLAGWAWFLQIMLNLRF